MTPNLDTGVPKEHLKAALVSAIVSLSVLSHYKFSEEEASVSLFWPDGAACQGNSSRRHRPARATDGLSHSK